MHHDARQPAHRLRPLILKRFYMHRLIFEIGMFSILLAVVIGWLTLQRIKPDYFPLLCLFTLALINESFSAVIIRKGFSNAISANIYSVLEAIILLWQFKRWGLFYKREKLIYGIAALYGIVLITEMSLFFSPIYFNSYFNATYAFITVLLSIRFINILMNAENRTLIKNPAFLFCVAFIIFYTFLVLIEFFFVYGASINVELSGKIFGMHAYVNLLCNLIFAIAFLWIPRKPKFIQLY